MKAKFKNPEDEKNFQEFVCANKQVLSTFFAFGPLLSGRIIRIVFKALGEILNVVCPEKKTN